MTLPAEVIADRYELQRLAGTGGMGVVYLATDRRSGGPVAIKLVHGDAELEAIERFVLESRLLSQLSHAGIVRYLDHGRVGGRMFLAMEWLEGVTLAQRLTRTGVTIDESVTIVRRVAEALGAAHRQGIVHRDIKPGNIFLVGDDVNAIKLLDFGVARLKTGSNGVTKTGAVVGTPGYMAPEQACAEREVDARADVFALGCVLFRCLTGKRPFAGEDVVAVLAKILLEDAPRVCDLRPEVPRGLDELVAHMLKKRPADRPLDGAVVAEMIAALGARTGHDLRTVREGPALTTEERRVVCVLFARTRAADKERMEDLRAAVAPQGGRLDLLADGSVLVTVERTGTPADQARRCARSALAMRATLPEIAIALAAGEGQLASRVPVGPVIERGAALLATADAREPVRIDDVMAGFLDPRFEVRAHGERLHLLGERRDDATTRTLLGRPSACVGRELELATLEATWRQCVDEPVARVVLVTAPAGAGKSRVRDELLRRVGDGTCEVWTARADPMSAGSPFGMIAEVLRRAIHGDAVADLGASLRARVAEVVPTPDVARVATFLGEIIGVTVESPAAVELEAARHDPQLMGDQLRRAWEDWLSGETARRPVLVVLEDVHWGDLASVSFVDAALRSLAHRPLLVLALARPEVYALFPNLWTERTLTELRLPPLPKKACARLVKDALGAAADLAIVQRLVERAEGNAFFLEELIRAVASGKGDELPGTVLAMVQARLDALHVEERRLLRAASIFGKTFSSLGVAALLGGEDAPTLSVDWLAELVKKELVSRRPEERLPGAYTFNHALVREAAYSTLTSVDRELGHRLAAEWLEGEGVSEPVLLAEHFERGGEKARAGGWYRRAAELSLEGNDFAAAIRWVERAIACGPKGEDEGALRLVECEARRWRGDNDLAEAAAAHAMRLLARGSAAWCEAATELATAAGALNHPNEIASLASELETVQPRGTQSQLVMALARVARPLFWTGRHALGSRVLARAVSLAERSGDVRPASLAALCMARGLQARVLGDPSECLTWNEAAVAHSERAGDRRLACLQRTNLGFSYLEIGANREAERTLADALTMAERLNLSRIVASAQQNLGVALFRRGALEEAARLEREALGTFEAQSDVRMSGGSLIYLALVEVAEGELERARVTGARAVEVLGDIAPLRCNALSVLGSVELELGLVAEGRAKAEEAFAILERLGGIEEGESGVRLAYAEALHASGDQRAAAQAIKRAHERLLERAAKIGSDKWRATFLHGIPENERTLVLAEMWTSA